MFETSTGYSGGRQAKIMARKLSLNQNTEKWQDHFKMKAALTYWVRENHSVKSEAKITHEIYPAIKQSLVQHM